MIQIVRESCRFPSQRLTTVQCFWVLFFWMFFSALTSRLRSQLMFETSNLRLWRRLGSAFSSARGQKASEAKVADGQEQHTASENATSDCRLKIHPHLLSGKSRTSTIEPWGSWSL